MSFSIEVPAETTPLTNQFLFQILQSAASNNPAQIQSGTKQLQHWETSPGFFSTLQVREFYIRSDRALLTVDFSVNIFGQIITRRRPKSCDFAAEKWYRQILEKDRSKRHLQDRKSQH